MDQYVCVVPVIKSIVLNTEWKVLTNVLESPHQKSKSEYSVSLVLLTKKYLLCITFYVLPNKNVVTKIKGINERYIYI